MLGMFELLGFVHKPTVHKLRITAVFDNQYEITDFENDRRKPYICSNPLITIFERSYVYILAEKALHPWNQRSLTYRASWLALIGLITLLPYGNHFSSRSQKPNFPDNSENFKIRNFPRNLHWRFQMIYIALNNSYKIISVQHLSKLEHPLKFQSRWRESCGIHCFPQNNRHSSPNFRFIVLRDKAFESISVTEL